MTAMTKPASRLITLIMLLQRQPNQKAADLAARLGVSVRTLHRYFAQLDEMGIPVYTERGPNGGFSLVRGYKMPPLVLDLEEATAVYLGASLVGEVWGSLYQSAAQGALAKLDNLLPDDQRHEVAWARRTLLAGGMHHTDIAVMAPVIEQWRRALRERTRMLIRYHGSQRTEERRVDPYALAYRWGWWYLVAFCHLRQAFRVFRLDRIETMEPTGETFTRQEDFDARTFMGREWNVQPRYRVLMQFEAGARRVALYNRAMWASVEEKADGSVLVQMDAADLEMAASTALAFGPLVSVIEPEIVRQTVAEWAEAILERYRMA
jgi:predicted DNA-binding transcriptional regulator YafY